MTMKHNHLKPMGCSKSSSKREFYSNKSSPQEIRQSNKQHNLKTKATQKNKFSGRKGIIKIREEINVKKKNETMETIAKLVL